MDKLGGRYQVEELRRRAKRRKIKRKSEEIDPGIELGRVKHEPSEEVEDAEKSALRIDPEGVDIDPNRVEPRSRPSPIRITC